MQEGVPVGQPLLADALCSGRTGPGPGETPGTAAVGGGLGEGGVREGGVAQGPGTMLSWRARSQRELSRPGTLAQEQLGLRGRVLWGREMREARGVS